MRSHAVRILFLLFFGAAVPTRADDCNLNGRDDAAEIASGEAPDCDRDGFPDDCGFVELLTGGGSALALDASPAALAAGDFDGDGRQDLAALYRERGRVAILRNAGPDDLDRGPEIPVCSTPTALLAADFDDDGADDLVVGCESEPGLRVLSPRLVDELWRTVLGRVPTALGTTDLDLDGLADLVVAFEDGLVALRNDGARGFTAGGGTDAAGTTAPAALRVDDIDGDGHPDVAVADPSLGIVTVLFGDADGPFAAAEGFEAGVEPVALVSADFDSDGDVDLATANRQSLDVGVLWQTGRRDFSLVPFTTTHETVTPASLAAGDLNGDGRADLALAGTRSDGNRKNWVVRTLVAFPRGGFAMAEDFTGGPPQGDDSRGSVLIVDLFDEPLPQIVTSTPGVRTLEVFFLETEGGGDPGCEAAAFRRGDVDGDGRPTVTDSIRILVHLFRGGPAVLCPETMDVDDSGGLEVTDAIDLLSFLFRGGPPPAAPFPFCGYDPSPDALECERSTCRRTGR